MRSGLGPVRTNGQRAGDYSLGAILENAPVVSRFISFCGLILSGIGGH